MEETFVMVKPEGVARGLVGEIVRRIESKGLEIKGLKLVSPTKDTVEELYAPHRGKPFFESLVKSILSGPVAVMVVHGPQAVSVVRTMIGATDPTKAAPGTIRGDFAVDMEKNVVHGADSVESAAREMSLFFEETELL